MWDSLPIICLEPVDSSLTPLRLLLTHKHPLVWVWIEPNQKPKRQTNCVWKVSEKECKQCDWMGEGVENSPIQFFQTQLLKKEKEKGKL